MSVLSLSPVSAGVYSKLNVAALTALATGGIFDDVPQGTAFPYVWFTVEEENARGLGRGGLRQINLRVHAESTYQGNKQLQQILSKAIELLEDQTLTITGYRQAGEIVYHETTRPFQQERAGLKYREAAANFTIWAEPT